MSNQDPNKKQSRKLSGSRMSSVEGISLTGRPEMGGIIGGGGYDFQTRYIVCHIPKWINATGFTQLFHEGTGDVDIHYGNTKGERREHIQVKDHQVKRAELGKVIDAFVRIDKGMPGVYDRFTLASPSLDQTLQSFESALKRLRDAKPFYETKPEALSPTEKDVRNYIEKLGLAGDADFILDKVCFHVGLPDFHNDGSSCDVFAINLLKQPLYKNKVLNMIKPVYPVLLQEVANSRGKTLNRAEIEGLIVSALKQDKEDSEPAIDLVIHNWTVEKFDRKPEYTLDWSSYFDRSARMLPDQRVWNEELLPELRKLRSHIASTTAARLVRLHGKCCLSTGIAFGAVFPTVGSWVIEVAQPPQTKPWRSDAVPEVGYALKIDEVSPDSAKLDPNSDSITFVFSITGNASMDVVKYVEDSSLSVKAIVSAQPPGASGSLSITTDREAASFALAARDAIKKALTAYKVHSAHLFFYGPLALAIFLGQKLTSVGRIQLYEFKDPGYVPSCTLNT